MAQDSYTGDLKSSRELNGVYRAIVEDNEDPEQKGRVKVRIPMIHGNKTDGISKDSLAWAEVVQTSSGFNYGSFIIPEVGERGLVIFEDCDVEKPVYIGSIYSTKTTQSRTYQTKDSTPAVGQVGKCEVPDESRRESPTCKMLYKSPAGMKIYVDAKSGQENITIQDINGQRFFIDQVKNEIRMDGTGGTVFVRGAEVFAGEERTGFYYNLDTGYLRITNGVAQISFGRGGISSSGTRLLAASNSADKVTDGGYIMTVDNIYAVCKRAAIQTEDVAIRTKNVYIKTDDVRLKTGNFYWDAGNINIYSDAVRWYVSNGKFRVYD